MTAFWIFYGLVAPLWVIFWAICLEDSVQVRSRRVAASMILLAPVWPAAMVGWLVVGVIYLVQVALTGRE